MKVCVTVQIIDDTGQWSCCTASDTYPIQVRPDQAEEIFGMIVSTVKSKVDLVNLLLGIAATTQEKEDAQGIV